MYYGGMRKYLLLVMELCRLRAREFLSARSTHDSREDESLAEALSSPNSAAMNWSHRDRDRGEATVSERGWSAVEKPLRCPFVSLCHLFVLRGNLGFDGQDQIRCGVSQLADVLIDVALPLQSHVVVHVPVRRAGREGCGGGGGGWVGEGGETTKQICCWCFMTFFIQSRGQSRNWST